MIPADLLLDALPQAQDLHWRLLDPRRGLSAT